MVPTVTTTIQHTFGRLNNSEQRTKRNKRNPDWKISKTLTVCRSQDLLLENSKINTRKFLINECSKAPGYKINADKLLASLYTNSEKTER